MKVAVLAVEASVIVSVAAADPTVRTAVADVPDDTVAVPKDAPVPPDSVKRLDVVKFPAVISAAQRVFVPVRVKVGVVPVVPLVGEIAIEGAAMAIVPVFVPSETVSVPVPDPVVMVSVPAVVDVTVCDTLAAPVTPETVKVVVPFTHEVPVPARFRVMLVL